MRNALWIVAALILSVSFSAALASPPATQPTSQDVFIAGYASAILDQDFHLEGASLTVRDGNVTVTTRELAPGEKESIRESLRKIAGVKEVRVIEAEPEPTTQTFFSPPSGGVETILAPQAQALFSLSRTWVFDPLLADPRWPHFAAAYDRYIGRAQNNEPGETNRDAGNVSLGESLSVFQSPVGKSGAFELGVQAAVFADFDMDLKTVDLINADYFVGLMAEYRQGDFSTLLRVFHQSSHLGDNFLLNNPGVTRFELSYEEPNVIFSEDLFHRSLRVYGGGGYLIDVVPSDLKPGVVESGVEYFGPPIFHNLSMIPVAAVDIQNREQNNWSADISARVGVQFQNPAKFIRRADLMLEYYDGHSPNGQFFLQKIQSLGIGLNLYL